MTERRELIGASGPEPAPRVLLVDDRVDNLLALEAVLEPLELDLVTVTSGADALAALLDDEFALMILDVQMPGMDGFETARLVKGRERTRLLPIIFLTAISVEAEHHLAGYRTGAVDYVFKPFNPEVLRAKVAVFVELWRRGRLIDQQRRALAEQLASVERLNGELERSNAVLDGFAARAAEDLLEPLDAMSGFLEVLSDRHLQAESAATELVERTAALADRQRERVAALLEYTELGSVSVESAPVEVAAVLGEATARLGDRMGDVAVSVVPGSLAGVRGDHGQLVRVLELLIDHAIRRDGATVVTVDARGEGGGALIRVADDGDRLTAGERPTLFNAMGDGADLGLAVCRRIVERHGGSIWAGAREPRGTAVEFTLPGEVAR